MKKFLSLLLILFFNFLSAQEGAYVILNTSINSKLAEFGVTYSSNNSVIFASSKKDESGRRTNNRQLSLELYHGMITKNGDIIQTDKFSSEINNKFFESDIAFTPDFKTIYFTWNNFYSALKSKDSAKWKTLYMFKASINKNFEISEVTQLPFNSTEYSVRSPAVSKDGKKLYFVSDMSGGYGELDIYVVEIDNDGNYGIPKNLGPTVNTKESEFFPFIDQNNTLFFSSNGYKGSGGLDIFKSEFKNGNFQQAKNLPSPINSKYDDFAYVFDNASNSGYFTSNRDGGKGDVDIYSFKVKEPVCVQTMNVLALNELTEEPLDQVQVSLFQNDKLVEKQTISKGLGFKFNIDCKQTYRIIAEKENYETAELTIFIDDKNKMETTKSLKLTPIECNQLLSGNILDSKTNLPIDQVVVSLFQNDQLIEKQTISKDSNYKFKISCKETYRLVAEKENYEPTELTVLSDEKNKVETKKSLKLTPIECNQLLSGNILDNKTNLVLDQVTVSLFQNNQLIEKQTISKDSNYKFNINCKETYRLVAEKENYEPTELTVSSDEKNKVETKKSLKLTPIECNQLLSGNILDNKTNLVLDQVTVSLFQNDKLVEKQTISKGLRFKFNIDCKQTYRIIAEKENYETAELTISTDDKNKAAVNKSLKLTPIECNQLLSGTISDSKTNLPIDQVQVSLFQNDKLVEKQIIGKASNYKFSINCKETYKIIAEKENYETEELSVTTDDKNKAAVNKSLKLMPIECNQFLSGTISDSKTNLPIDQVQVSLFQNDKLVVKQTISKGFGYKFGINCEETYRIVAEKENYETAELIFSTDDKNKAAVNKSLKLTPIECNQLLSGTISDSKTNLPIDQVQVSLFQNDKLVEKQIIGKASNYKFSINCNETYKIIGEKENYITSELSISTDDKNKSEITKILKLTPIECNQFLSGTISDSKMNLPIDQVMVSLFQNDKLIEKQIIGKGSNYKFSINCKETYKIIAEKENYEPTELTFSSDDKNKMETTEILKLTPIECVQLLNGTISDSKTNLPIAMVTVSLFQDNRLIEKQTFGKGLGFKFNINCKETYRLVTEKENYKTSELTISSDDKNKSEITKTLKLTPVECNQLLSGNILDNKTNLALDQVTVSLFQNNKLIEKQTISKGLAFTFNIDCKQTYKLVAEKENYVTAELAITTDDKYNFETKKSLRLTPIECVQFVSGTVTDSETNLPLPNAIIHIYKGKELLAKISLDENATFSNKLECDMPYRFTVSLKNYHDLVSTIKTSDKTNETINIQLQMESSIEFVEVREQKMIKTKTINFDLNQSSIKLDAAIELNKVIAILRKYPSLKIEIKSHTDSRASADYNLKLTNDRANKVIDYIISNGIDSSRVSGRGYGETQLLNNCAKGVKCSEAEHQLNRRTEFIITGE